MFVMSGLIGASSQVAINNLKSVKRSTEDISNLSAAEAGAERAIASLKAGNINTLTQVTINATCTWCNTNIPLYSAAPASGQVYYHVTITKSALLSGEIQVLSQGKFVPTGGSVSSPKNIRKIRVYLTENINNPFPYAVQTGPGGLQLSNSATIANGEVYVNGGISMTNSSRIGTILTPVEVWAAHQNCPTSGGSTYPTVCTTGQPISFANSAHIYGDVHALNQTANPLRMSNDGLVDNIAPPITLPVVDRTAIKASATVPMTASAASCSGFQTRTWSNVHITGGDVTVSNSCVVTVTGNVWIDGGLTVQNTATMKVGDLLTSAPFVIIDGSSGFKLQNLATVVANPLNAAFQFVTYYCGSGCSPDSLTVTGNQLFSSQNIETITIQNNSAGAGSIFYARWSKARLKNSGSVGALVGQTVQLDNSGAVSFGALLGSNPTGNSYSVKHWQPVKN